MDVELQILKHLARDALSPLLTPMLLHNLRCLNGCHQLCLTTKLYLELFAIGFHSPHKNAQA
ncbi:hypothetical protein [Scytonema sp. PRP1]|uniref:hypothetical protein n=1 Tax=Scytonema sp. PRP1 TaxID=3120513 RepID=UPI002FD73BAF